MAYRDLRGRRKVVAALRALVAIVGSAGILYLGAILLFTDRYPDLPDSPLPAPPGLWGGLAVDYPVRGPLLAGPSVGPAQIVSSPALEEMSAYYIARTAWLRDAWHPISRSELPTTERGWEALADRYAAEISLDTESTDADASMTAARSLVGQVRQLAEETVASSPAAMRIQAALFPDVSSLPRTTLFDMDGFAFSAPAPPESGGASLMDEPFETRIARFPYAPQADSDEGSRWVYTSPYTATDPILGGGLGLTSTSGWSGGIWASRDLSGMRYRTYVYEGGPFTSPFLDPFGADLASSIESLVGPGLGGEASPFDIGVGPGNETPEDPWMDNPIYSVPR